METIFNFLLANTDWLLFGMILFSGLFVKEYVNVKVSNVYKILITSVLISFIFYILSDCKSDCLNKYIFTYLFATSTYELILSFVLKFLGFNNSDKNAKIGIGGGIKNPKKP